MRIALRIESPSPESRLLAKVFEDLGEVEILDPWDIRSHTETYDLAVGAGPVTSCPLARAKLLFVLGPTAAHSSLGWDHVIVTSQKAAKNAERFNCEVHPQAIPLSKLNAGRRRLMGQTSKSLCASPIAPPSEAAIHMTLWGNPTKARPFSTLEFNSLCRNGAYGYYVGFDDGYDVQARRHLALGSPVVCDCDPEVLGSLTSYCVRSIRDLPPTQEVVPDGVELSSYVNAVKEIVRRI